MKIVSLTEAKQTGAPRYFTGAPCKRGHVAERFVSTRACVICHVAAAAAYRENNPAAVSATEARRYAKHRDRILAKAKAWAQANPEKTRAWASAWAAKNPERKKASFRAWRNANRDKAKAGLLAWRAANADHVRCVGLVYRNQRRAALLNRTPAWADLDAIKVIYQDAAEFRAAGLEVDVDHEIPLQGEFVSGLHVPQNLRVCLSSFNRSKSNMYQIS